VAALAKATWSAAQVKGNKRMIVSFAVVLQFF
jgi:hypothetical protein